MATDLQPWKGFGKHLREARERSGLTLAQIGLRSASALSRLENDAAAPSRELVERYAELTGNSNLLSDFMSRASPNRAAPDVEVSAPPSFHSLLRLTDLETIVDVRDDVTITERRTMVAQKPSVSRARLAGFMAPVDGVLPSLIEAYAYGAEVTGQSWLDKNVLAIDFELPAPLRQGDPEYSFHLVRRFDRLAPRFTQTSGYSIRQFRLTLAFPRVGYTTFLIDGIPPQMAGAAIEAARSGKSHDLPTEVLTDRKQTTYVFNNVEAARSYGFAWVEPDLRN